MNNLKRAFVRIIVSLVAISATTSSLGSSNINKNSISNVNNDKEKIILRISHTDRANSIKGKFFIRFKELLEEKNPGLEVVLKEYGNMATREHEFEALELGLVDMIAPDIEQVYRETSDDTLRVLKLPFLFESNQDFKKFLLSPSSGLFIKDLNFKNKPYMGIGLIGEGYEFMTSTQKLNNINDIKEKNLLTTSPLTQQTFLNQLKLKSFEYSDMEDIEYIKKTSKSNLFEVNMQQFINKDLGEQMESTILTKHNYKTSIVIVNKLWLEKLPTPIQLNLIKLLQDNKAYNYDLIIKNEDVFKDRVLKIYDKKIKNLEKEDKEYLKNLSKPIHEFYMERINRNLLLNIYKDLQK